MTFNTDFPFSSFIHYSVSFGYMTELIIICFKKYAEHLPFPLSLQKKAKSRLQKKLNSILYKTNTTP